MTTLEDLIRGLPEPPPHPRLRDWGDRLKREGTTATVEVTGTRSVLGQTLPTMYVQFTENGELSPLEEAAWEADLNEGLIQLAVRASSPEQEAERFALGLRAAMQRPARMLGDGYFNSVLVDLLTQIDLTRYPAIADVLKDVYVNSPSHEGKARINLDYCRDSIASAIRGRMRELTGPLKYPEVEATRILTEAIAIYLDGRFSVSSRRLLGRL